MKSFVLSCVLLAAAAASAQQQAPPRELVFRAGYDNGPAIVNLQLKDQHRLLGLTQIGIVQYVIWQCDNGASSMQLAFRRAGVQHVITPLMVPGFVGSVSGTVACSSKDGASHQWEGNAVPCSTFGSIGLGIGDTIETTDSPTADGVSKSCSAYLVVQ